MNDRGAGGGTGYQTVTFLSDLGTADEMVGVVHSTLHQSAPAAAVIDLCHEVEPGDTRTAALLLARSVGHLAPGVVLVSVGRRLERPAIAVSVGDGQSVLVGPDNGSLAAAAAAVGGADAAYRLGESVEHAESHSVAAHHAQPALHPARDVLAPAAGRIAAGEALEALGTPIDPATLLPSLVAVPRVENDGSVTAEVLSLTRWGTVQLNVDRELVSSLGDPLVAEWTSTSGPAPEQTTQSVRLAAPDAGAGSGLLLADDPYGLLEFTVAGGSAAHLGFSAGAEVRLRRAE